MRFLDPERDPRSHSGHERRIDWLEKHRPTIGPDWLLLRGVGVSIPSVPIGDSDHAKFDPDFVLTNDASLWTFDLDASDLIKQVNVSEAGLYQASASGDWGAPTGSYIKSTTLNMTPNHGEAFNGASFLGMSNTVSSLGSDETDHFVGAMCPISEQLGFSDHGGYFTVEPSHDNGADVLFTAPYFWVTRFELEEAEE